MDDVAEIAKTIVKGVDRKGWIKPHPIPVQQIGVHDGWTLSVRIIGVGCGHSYAISLPARISRSLKAPKNSACSVMPDGHAH